MKINGEIAITGKNVAKLPKNIKGIIADKVINLLKQHKQTMLQFKSDELITKFFDQGDAVILLEKKTDQLIGFGKNKLWAGKNEYGQKVYEFGSWIINKEFQHKGYGHYLTKLAVKSLKEKDPSAQLIAVCDFNSKDAIKILKHLGAVEIPKPKNVKILLEEGQANVLIFDMSIINY
ncbi:GNAT family N-acetyltransferase [bacterium]|nr:MAG: GNAT family N-acetyltransferase [bacterium]